MDVHSGDIVAIQGIGGLGHLAVQFSNAMGFRTVALSSSASKKDMAHKLGAVDYIDGSKVDQVKALQELGGAKVIVCTAPNSKIIQNLVGGLTVGGQLLILGLPEEPATVSLGMCVFQNHKLPLCSVYANSVRCIGALIAKRLSIIGWPSGHAKDSEDTVLFAKQARIHTMIEKFPLDKAQEAYDHLPKARFRAVIVP